MELLKPRKVVVVSHADCFDGHCAAWVFRLLMKDCLDVDLENATFYKCKYGADARALFSDLYMSGPYFSNHDLFILDFSFFGKELAWLAGKFKSVTVIDHHKGAVEEIEEHFSHGGVPGNLNLLLDMRSSGCKLTYEHLVSQVPDDFTVERNWLIDAVNDHDLWQFKDPNTKALIAYIASQPMTFEAWDELFINPEPLEVALAKGQAIRKVIANQLQWHIDNCIVWVDFKDHKIPMLNAPRYNASDLADQILALHPEAKFCMVWYRESNEYHYSLRSRKGFDVSPIAASMGGGGHAGAASFRLKEPLSI